MGHVLSADGLAPDPEKVSAVLNMESPSDVKGVQRLLGVVTYLAKFLPQLSSISEPLRRLTDKDAEFNWMTQHDVALLNIKKLITQAPILKFCDVNQDVTIECDSSDVGLGAVLSQEGRPIAYASRALTATERNYAQIEKECLAIVYATERFQHYILGKEVFVQSDHKPLMAIFKKPILSSPKRLQRMRLRLQKFSLSVEYKPGPTMYISDTLSRAALPLQEVKKDTAPYLIYAIEEHTAFCEEVEGIQLEDEVFMTDNRLHQIRIDTGRDNTLQVLMKVISQGWPVDDAKRTCLSRHQDYYTHQYATRNDKESPCSSFRDSKYYEHIKGHYVLATHARRSCRSCTEMCNLSRNAASSDQGTAHDLSIAHCTVAVCML